jgi:hypothetical protein
MMNLTSPPLSLKLFACLEIIKNAKLCILKQQPSYNYHILTNDLNHLLTIVFLIFQEILGLK